MCKNGLGGQLLQAGANSKRKGRCSVVQRIYMLKSSAGGAVDFDVFDAATA